MALGILVLITALHICCSDHYSIWFGCNPCRSVIPIMIMGGVLEVGKLVIPVWLHKYWRQASNGG